MSNRNRPTLVEVLVLATLTAFVGTITVAVAGQENEQDRRTRCAANLRDIGRAIKQYHDDSEYRFPRTVSSTDAQPDADPVPTWGTSYGADGQPGPVGSADPFATASPVCPKPNDVTASLFLLLRTGQLKPAAFVCPSTDATPFDYGGDGRTARDWTNWPGDAGIVAHLSYSCANAHGSIHAGRMGLSINRPYADYALVGDMNPGGATELQVTPTASADSIRQSNSRNHQGDGQNLLYGDGHVDFATTPFAGHKHDNVYTAGGPEVPANPKYVDRQHVKVAGSPVDDSDTVLLPSASDLVASR